MSLNEFRADVQRSLEILGKYQTRIYGYRPPGFSMPYDHDHLMVLKDCGLAYVSSGPSISACAIAKGQKPLTLGCGLIHVPISYYSLKEGRILFPIGYGSFSRLLPERLYLLALKYWFNHYDFFHFYFHPFELSGLSNETRAFVRKHFSNHLRAVIFGLRCHNRIGYFTEILSLCRFQTIESFLDLRPD